MKNILIVIFTFNEAKNISKVLDEILKISKNILVVDNNSSDETINIVKRYSVNFIKHKYNLGKSNSMKTGLDFSRINNYDYIAFMDGDNQHSARDMLNICNKIVEINCDLVIGYRKDFADIVERLELPVMNNFGGVDAYFNKKTNAYSNEGFSEMTIPQLTEFLRNGDPADLIGIYGIRRDNLLNLLEFMADDGIDISGTPDNPVIFDKNFQDRLITYAAYHENKKSLDILGDVSWIKRIPLDGEAADKYFELFGKIEDKDNDGNVWNEIQYLLRYAADYKVDMDTNGYDKEKEDKE